MKQKKWIIVFSLLIGGGSLWAQSEHGLLLEANSEYKKNEFRSAELTYRKILKERNPESIKANYNLGNSMYKQDSFAQAVRFFQQAADIVQDDYLKSKAYYNLGNAYLKRASKTKDIDNEQLQRMINEYMQKNPDAERPKVEAVSDKQIADLKKAREAYKQTLRISPTDYDAKNNLAFVQRQLNQIQKAQQKQQQQQQQQKQNPQNNPQDQQENQDPKDQDENQQNQQVNSDPSKRNTQKQNMTEDEVKRLMQIIENEDKKVQEKMLQKMKGNRKDPEKDW